MVHGLCTSVLVVKISKKSIVIENYINKCPTADVDVRHVKSLNQEVENDSNDNRNKNSCESMYC